MTQNNVHKRTKKARPVIQLRTTRLDNTTLTLIQHRTTSDDEAPNILRSRSLTWRHMDPLCGTAADICAETVICHCSARMLSRCMCSFSLDNNGVGDPQDGVAYYQQLIRGSIRPSAHESSANIISPPQNTAGETPSYFPTNYMMRLHARAQI
jgi:hypothetical protein